MKLSGQRYKIIKNRPFQDSCFFVKKSSILFLYGQYQIYFEIAENKSYFLERKYINPYHLSTDIQNNSFYRKIGQPYLRKNFSSSNLSE